MVNNQSVFLPKTEDLLSLGKLRGKISVLRVPNVFRVTKAIFLMDMRGTLLKVSSEYESISFKFEYFGLMLSELPPDAVDLKEVDDITNWVSIDLLFRYEWGRPLRIDETPIYAESAVYGRGKLIDMPRDAERAGLSMVGIAFKDSDNRCVAVLRTEDNDPPVVSISKSKVEIDLLVSECECMAIEPAVEWIKSISPKSG